MKKKILITGAGGFIGSFLVEKALEENFETWAGTRSDSDRSYLQDDRIQFIDLHYQNRELLKVEIREHVALHGKWDYIIHNAGATKCRHTADFDTINYRYTAHLVGALRETRNSPERFLLMSSLSTAMVKNAYAQSKIKAEEVLRSSVKFPYIILQPAGVYGPREKDYFLMMKAIQAGWDITAGCKEQKLSFIYVTDLVNAAFSALKSQYICKVYPISDGQVYTNREYTQIVKECLGKKHVLRIKIPLVILYAISTLCEWWGRLSGKPSTLNRDKYRIMEHRDWSCDISSAVKYLFFKPEYDLKRGMDACVKWYRENGWL